MLSRNCCISFLLQELRLRISWSDNIKFGLKSASVEVVSAETIAGNKNKQNILIKTAKKAIFLLSIIGLFLKIFNIYIISDKWQNRKGLYLNVFWEFNNNIDPYFGGQEVCHEKHNLQQASAPEFDSCRPQSVALPLVWEHQPREQGEVLELSQAQAVAEESQFNAQH